MVGTDELFAGSIPEIYDRLLVPLIFESYAVDLVARVAQSDPRNVLKTAAGTGVVTRTLAARLRPEAQITATDLNAPMLARAETRQSDDGRVTWRQADALALPFDDGSFDAVACQFGVMFFPDKVQAYREARRVLQPGGRFVFNVWDRISENEFADVVTGVLASVFPADPPRFLARIPYGYHDAEKIREELAAAGFSSLSIAAVEGSSAASSPRHPAIAFRHGTPLRNEIEARDPGRLDEATDRAAEALTGRFGTGPIAGRMRAFAIAAVR